jgi:N6-adenosine-specific RNA methylase IME4
VTWGGLNPPYSTIVADPPWEYRTTRPTTTARSPGTNPSAAAQYSTLSAVDLAALPVADLAAVDAHLYLWTTNPHLRDAFGVLDAWGFTYATTLTWLKTGTLGMGFYFRGDTEHVLFGVRGRLPIPADRRRRNWFQAPKTGHSRKPAAFGDLVEDVSPGPYVELFARAPRLGWDAWGRGYES